MLTRKAIEKEKSLFHAVVTGRCAGWLLGRGDALRVKERKTVPEDFFHDGD
ncbi:MAG TPA: hypothetical protein VJX67_09040 [Blastocatellia bacterium]|nr:hypothetical protein [Blastocatellia bacterium]